MHNATQSPGKLNLLSGILVANAILVSFAQPPILNPT